MARTGPTIELNPKRRGLIGVGGYVETTIAHANHGRLARPQSSALLANYFERGECVNIGRLFPANAN